MPKLVWRVKLVAELRPGVMTETEVARIERVAAVTDSTILTIAPKIAEHFAHPEFKVFRSGERANALAWLQGA